MRPEGGAGSVGGAAKGPSRQALEVGFRLLAQGHNKRIDRATAEVFEALERGGIRAMILKGPATVRWLYDSPAGRPYGDIDVLVRTADLGACEEVLSGLGFVHHEDPDLFGRELDERTWTRDADATKVDLHLTIFGAEADPDRVFDVLYSESEIMDVGGVPVHAPSIPARACHLALHAVEHSEVVQRPLDDLILALEKASPDVWLEAWRVAERIEAAGAFALGLRIVPEGRAVAAALDLPDEASREARLFASGAPPLAVGLEYLRQERGWRDRLGLIGRTAWPPRDYLVARHPWAARGRMHALVAHLWHPLWLVKALARALPAYLRAGRRSR